LKVFAFVLCVMVLFVSHALVILFVIMESSMAGTVTIKKPILFLAITVADKLNSLAIPQDRYFLVKTTASHVYMSTKVVSWVTATEGIRVSTVAIITQLIQEIDYEYLF